MDSATGRTTPCGRDVDSDSVLRAGVEIDVVVADAASADRAQARDSFERLRGHARLEGDDHVVVVELPGQRIRGGIRGRNSCSRPSTAIEQGQADVGKREAAVVAQEIGGEANAEMWRSGHEPCCSSTTTQSWKMGTSAIFHAPLASGVMLPMSVSVAVGGIEKEGVIGAGLEVAEGGALIRRGGKCDDGLAGNVRGEGLPVIFLAPARFDEVRLRLEFPPRVAHEQRLGHSQLARPGKRGGDVPCRAAPGVAVRREPVGFFARVHLPDAVGAVGVARRRR